MLKKIKSSIIKNLRVLGLLLLIIFTIAVAVISNHKKNLAKDQYNNFINNIYLKKTNPNIFEFWKKNDRSLLSIL